MPGVQNSILKIPLDVENRNSLPAFLKLLYVPIVFWEEQKRTVSKKMRTKENLFDDMQSFFLSKIKKSEAQPSCIVCRIGWFHVVSTISSLANV
jgi:hypothetical protein